MNRKNTKQIIIYSVFVVAVAISVALGIYKYFKVQTYNKLINNANNYMENGNYNEAIAIFNESLQYKNDPNVKRSIILAESLLSSERSYEQGNKQMENKEFLKAIESFKKVVKEDEKRYEESQKKMEECKKLYIAINLENASKSAKNNKYDEANKYLDDILKIDSKNTQAKKLKDTYLKEIKQSADNAKQESNSQDTGVQVTVNEAIEIVAKYLNSQGTKIQFTFDHEDIKNGINYYVIQAFENMGDHIATSGWYYVDKNSRKVYEWDLATDELVPLN